MKPDFVRGHIIVGRRDPDGKVRTHKIPVPHGDEEATVAKLRGQPDVEFVELDEIVRPQSLPTDPLYPTQWHAAKIGLPTAWDRSIGAGVIVAVVDGGVQSDHPDLAANMVPGWNVYDDNANTGDVTGHGTAVAGTIAAVGNSIGVVGVAYGAKIMPIRASAPDGSGMFSLAAEGITWAADHGAKVVNVSWANLYKSSAVKAAGAYLKSKGGVLVVSANNNAIDEGVAPVSEMVVVAATDQNDALCSWSSYGAMVDVAAPGVDIRTTVTPSTYNTGGGAWGTSFSTPIVSGVLALLMSAKPDITPDAAVAAVVSTAVGTQKRINAAAAVALVAPITIPKPSMTGRYGRTELYTSVLPVRLQAPDYCGVSAYCYAMEIVNLLQGGKPVQLSALYARVPGSSFETGYCREAYHPNVPYEGINIASQEYDFAVKAATVRVPTPEAVADANNFKVLPWGQGGWDSISGYQYGVDRTPEEIAAVLKQKCMDVIDNGGALCILLTYKHAACAWDYDDSGLLGLNSMSTSKTPFQKDWREVTGPITVIKKVQFADPDTLPVPPPFVFPPLPPLRPPQTRIQMDVASAIAKLNAVDANTGFVSQAEKDATLALVTGIPVATVATPPPPSGASWKIAVYDVNTYTSEDGAKWKARDWTGGRCALTRNGVYMGTACGEVFYPGTGGTVYCKSTDNTTWKYSWNGSALAGWKVTPPGYA